MRKVLLLHILVITAGFCMGQNVKLITYDQLEKMRRPSEANLVVINFWATWCGPCIKELPYFLEADQMDNVEVVFVSLDFPDEQEKVERFSSNRIPNRQVFLLNETDYDSYITRINNDWSGALPATLMIDTRGKEYFFERSFSRDELMDRIKSYLN